MLCTKMLSTCALLIGLLAGWATTAHAQWEAPAGFYSSITGTGATLKNQLESRMKSGHILRNYGSFRFSAAITDQDPNNSSNILLGYTRESVSSNWDSGSTWNREHVWPQSKQPGSASNGSSNALSDPFSLRPLNPSVNSSRGNKSFGTATTTGSNGHVGSFYFPGDADKGDVARALFYHDTRWDDNGIALANGNPGGNTMGDLAALLQWHYLDPPDEFEQRRNHTIYSQAYNPSYYSNNRNAYIDRPEYVWSVYVDQANDSRVALGGASVGADGSSTLNLDLGSVLVGGPAPSSQSVSLTKSGNDGTYYSVTPSGAATSTLEGRHNAFRSNGTDSESFSVGVAANTSTAGSYNGAVTIDNLDVTTLGGAGRGANDANDTVNLSFEVLDHASPSFSGASQQLALSYNFGTVPQGSAAPTFGFDLFNLESTASFTAGLDLDNILGTGDTGVLSTDLSLFSDLAAGLSSSFTATMSTASAGSYAASYQLSFSDEDLPGASALSTLTLNLSGMVAGGGGLLGDTDLDADIDAADIDTLYANLGSAASLYDIDLDGGVADQQDVDQLVQGILGTEYGDTNLDGNVTIGDLNTVSLNLAGSGVGGWADGDFSGEGLITIGDLNTVSLNLGFMAPSSSIPEPGAVSIALLAISGLWASRRR